MCNRLIPVRSLRTSPARLGVVPAPGLVQLSLPGLAFALAISSGMVLMSDCAGTTKALGDAPMTITGTKSLYGS